MARTCQRFRQLDRSSEKLSAEMATATSQQSQLYARSGRWGARFSNHIPAAMTRVAIQHPTHMARIRLSVRSAGAKSKANNATHRQPSPAIAVQGIQSHLASTQQRAIARKSARRLNNLRIWLRNDSPCWRSRRNSLARGHGGFFLWHARVVFVGAVSGVEGRLSVLRWPPCTPLAESLILTYD